MAKSKKYNISTIIIFSFLSIFALGQLIKLNIDVGGATLGIAPIDVLACIASLIYVLPKRKIDILVKIPSVFYVAFFSLLLSLNVVSLGGVIVGAMYFVRALTYYFFYLFLRENVSDDTQLREIIIKTLVFIGLVIALLGLIQYVIYPDLTGIVALGWDNHLYRLVGSFIDPGFTGLFLAFAILVGVYMQSITKDRRFVWIIGVMVIALLLTYSRASYLALLAGLAALFVANSNLRKITAVYAFIFMISIPLLPRPNSIGVKLERTGTVVHRINNYDETISIWRNNPVFGVGYNTLCAYKKEILKRTDVGEHSCSGADSSLLLLLATTGVIGACAFVNDALKIIKASMFTKNALFTATLFSLFVHSLFVNSMFYSWTMGWIGLIACVTKLQQTLTTRHV
ncbi:O-antigen ligase family protein [Candidatus Woesebacteria bacterium]|nr:MAG: O-antigen ligase family protein [Candidatus Woesebacteria bacterium]